METKEMEELSATNDRLHLASLTAVAVHAPRELGKEYRTLRNRVVQLSQPLLPPPDEQLEAARALAKRIEASGAFADLEPEPEAT